MGITNNIYLKARLKTAEHDTYLNDRFFVCSRFEKLSYEELSRIENDDSYIPKPDISANLISCYNSLELAEGVCDKCPVSTTIKKSIPKNTNFNVARDNKQKQTVLKKVSAFDSTKNTIYYKSRMIHSLRDMNFKNRRYVAEDVFGITDYQLKQIENDPTYITHTSTTAHIIEIYANQVLFSYVCQVCPVTKSKKGVKSYGKKGDY